jgi:hypothetical protein
MNKNGSGAYGQCGREEEAEEGSFSGKKRQASLKVSEFSVADRLAATTATSIYRI